MANGNNNGKAILPLSPLLLIPCSSPILSVDFIYRRRHGALFSKVKMAAALLFFQSDFEIRVLMLCRLAPTACVKLLLPHYTNSSTA
jgi:hypothetical protein